MLKFLHSHLLPVLLLLFTFCILILCPSCMAYGSSFYPNRMPVQQEFEQHLEPGEATSSSTFDENILSIFKIGPESGLVLFNTTPEPQNSMRADEAASSDNNPIVDREQAFKVQRSPDGKLNLVFNDFLIFQTTTKAPTPDNRNSGGGSSSWISSPATQITNTNRNDAHECKEKREGKPYCINVPNYLQVTQLNQINKQEFSRFEALFGEDVVELPNIAQRMNGEPEDVYHCTSKAKTIFPQKGETRDAGWMYIVNNDEYKQGVLVEICENEGKTCEFSDTLPNKYSSSCKQHYIYRVLVAVAPNKTMTKQHFKIPSCCKCALKQHSSSIFV